MGEEGRRRGGDEKTGGDWQNVPQPGDRKYWHPINSGFNWRNTRWRCSKCQKTALEGLEGGLMGVSPAIAGANLAVRAS